MATTATITLSADKVVPGEKFSVSLTLAKDVAYEVISITPTATDECLLGVPDLRSRTWTAIVRSNPKEATYTFGARLLLSDGTIVVATGANLLCLGSDDLSASRSNQGGEVGELLFNQLADSGLVAAF